MSMNQQDEGLIEVVLERFNTQRLPRALALKEKVDRGERLDDFDLNFLQEVFADAQKIHSFLDRHPEYQDLAAMSISLYKEISDKALENEKNQA